MACITHGFRLEVSGLIGAKAILGHDLMLRESKLKGLSECGYMCVFGHDWKREPGKQSWNWSEWESTNKTFEGSKNSNSWKNIYTLKDSHCGKTRPIFIKTKWNSMRDMAPWREARPKWEHQCINKYVGQVEMYSVKRGHGRKEKTELPKQRQNTQTQALPFFLIPCVGLVTHTWKYGWYLFHLLWLNEWVGRVNSICSFNS